MSLSEKTLRYIVYDIKVLGAIVGSYVWWRRPQSRLNPEEYIQYKAMLIRLVIGYQVTPLKFMLQ